jgi:hypothetical protein
VKQRLSFTRGVHRFDIVPTTEAAYEGRLNGVAMCRDADRGVVARRLLTDSACQRQVLRTLRQADAAHTA